MNVLISDKDWELSCREEHLITNSRILGLFKIIGILAKHPTWEKKKCLDRELPLKPFYYDTQTSLLRILLLIAKKMIAVSSLRLQPPTVTRWREKIKDVFYMKHIIAGLQLKTDIFLTKPAAVISHIFE